MTTYTTLLTLAPIAVFVACVLLIAATLIKWWLRRREYIAMWEEHRIAQRREDLERLAYAEADQASAYLENN